MTRPAGVGAQLHVLMYDRLVAVLQYAGTKRSRVTLTYTADAAEVTRGLSCCLPVVGRTYAGDVVDNWISGLLPDRSEVLARWRTQFGLTRQDTFALLWHVGQDVAGAARFVRPDSPAVEGDAGWLEPLTADGIGERIRALHQDAAAWLPSVSTGQFSLAGAQAKFALARTDSGWAEPHGSAPTTHIFKPAIPDMLDQDLNEHLTMRLAAAVGLSVAPTEVMEFDGERALVVTRFDRYQLPDGRWRRMHQEDAVQAMGKAPALKYEQQQGPGVPQIVELLRQNVTGGQARNDIGAFIDAIAFNWLVVGTDAHARNFTLMHHGRATRLAPLYDLNSFLAYRGTRSVSLAMKIGFSERDPALIAARDWEELSRDCGLDSAEVIERVRAMAGRVLDHAPDVLQAGASQWPSKLPRTFQRELTKHVRACQQRL